MNLEFQFANSQQKEFYYATARNQLFSGGFNNGKTYILCLKGFTLLTTFPNYRLVLGRQVYADLKKTTMQTFFKICPTELIDRHNEQDGFTILKNKSMVHWLHLDNVEESTLRGLETNSVGVDQEEETEEKMYDILDARVGRWDNAVVPPTLLERVQNWPKNRVTGKLIAPSYNMGLCNPDTQFHYLFRRFHPDSLERRAGYYYVEAEWDPNLGSVEGYQEALKHDSEWIDKYVRGQWGVSNAQIHRVETSSLLEYSEELIDRIKRKGNLFRVMDHGDSSPTCCLWFAALDGVFICYREYYCGNQPISYHRSAIADLSGDERYSANYADPQIFKKTAQKLGGFWTVADEYLTKEITGPPIAWLPADNNEHATRNRVNELLRSNERHTHPVTKLHNAPGLYFIKQHKDYPNGCFYAIQQLQSQRRKLIGYIDGKAVYCDDREEGVTDHAYDPVRYFVAMHGSGRSPVARSAPPMSFKWFKYMKERQKGILVHGSQLS